MAVVAALSAAPLRLMAVVAALTAAP